MNTSEADSPLGKRKAPDAPPAPAPAKKLTPKVPFRPKLSGSNVLPSFPPPPPAPVPPPSPPKEEPEDEDVDEPNPEAPVDDKAAAADSTDQEDADGTNEPAQDTDMTDADHEDDAAEEEGEEEGGKKKKRKNKRRRATVDPVEEDDEEEDTSMMTLGEIAVLCSRNRGKRKKLNANAEGQEGAADAEEAPEEAPAPAPERPQVEFIDGKLVVNEESLVATVPAVPRRVAQEGDTEYRLSQNSFRRRKISHKQWSQEDTQEFYTALRVFGPNLTHMGLLMRSRTREQLRNKLRLEEKNNPHLVDFAVKHRLPITEEEVSALLRGEDVVISSPHSSAASSAASSAVSSAASSRSSSPAPRRRVNRIRSLRTIVSDDSPLSPPPTKASPKKSTKSKPKAPAKKASKKKTTKPKSKPKVTPVEEDEGEDEAEKSTPLDEDFLEADDDGEDYEE